MARSIVTVMVLFVFLCDDVWADEPAGSPNENQTIRLLLLLPGGPIVVDADVTIDGRPFGEFREKYIERTLKAADLNEDGKVSLDEAIADGKLFASRLPYARSENREARLVELKKFDADKDCLINKPEARAIVARYGGGMAFSLLEAAYRSSMARAPVRELLDTNNDGSIDQSEFATAASRLKSRDADDNDILYIRELTEKFTQPSKLAVKSSGQVQATSLVIHLTAATDWKVVERILCSRYGGETISAKRHFRLTQSLAKHLDKNSDGMIGHDELNRLLQFAPHLHIGANLGRTGELPEGIVLKSISDELDASDHATSKLTNTVMIELPGTHLQLTVSTITRNATNFQGQAKAYMRFDVNKNGYLEKSELNEQRFLLRIFDQADLDGNGMVFVDELETYFRRGVELQMNRVSAAASDQGNSLFATIDENGDGRLTAREMRNAGNRLKDADKNGDGKITAEEIPTTIRVALARGSYASQALNNARRTNMGGYAVRSPLKRNAIKTPRWFLSMDRNGDGDVSQREFLGGQDQFDKLDANGDGFIEPGEAEE